MRSKIVLMCVVTCCIVCAQDEPNEGFACSQGETLVENECNFCFCSKGSLGICTKMVWSVSKDDDNNPEKNEDKHILSEWSDSLQVCNAGSKWMTKCNKCWCVKDVGKICQDKNCKKSESIGESSQNKFEEILRSSLISKLKNGVA